MLLMLVCKVIEALLNLRVLAHICHGFVLLDERLLLTDLILQRCQLFGCEICQSNTSHASIIAEPIDSAIIMAGMRPHILHYNAK